MSEVSMDNAVEILHTLDIPIFRISPEGHTQFLNINCADLYRVDPIKIESLHFSEWLDAETSGELNRFTGGEFKKNPKLEYQVKISFDREEPMHIRWTVVAFSDLKENIRFFQIHGNDITEIVNREQLVKHHSQQFKWTFDNSPVPLWREDFSEVVNLIDSLKADGVTDFDKYLQENPQLVRETSRRVRILDVNRATLDAFGYQSKEEILGERSEAFCEETLETFRLEMIAIANGEESFAIESPAALSNGKLVSTLIFMKFPKQRELFKEIIIAHIDISELKETQRALEKAKEDAEEANKAKSTFVSNISHEIRTPLNGIIGFTRLLSQEDLNGQQRDFVTTIQSCCDTLLNLINQVLDLSKIESVKLAVHNEPFRIDELLNEIGKVQNLGAQAKGVELQVILDPTFPKAINGDRLKINQIVSNLARNAVKFCNEGSIIIQGYGHKDELEIVVSDTGIGIGEEALKSIFDPFSQEDNSDTRKHTGSGLGLTIARELTRTLGGELTLESEKEKGTRCRVRIPCEATDIEVSKNENESNQKINANATEGLRVLIVDDNNLNIKLLQQFLKPYKLEVDSCLNGQLALEKIRIIEYDAIFMDLQMPVLDGYETVKKIRAGDAGYNSMNVPIAVVSANVLQGEIDRVNALDVKHFIPKPVDPNIVQSFLAMAVQSKSTNSII